jgi:hypothetical protein
LRSARPRGVAAARGDSGDRNAGANVIDFRGVRYNRISPGARADKSEKDPGSLGRKADGFPDVMHGIPGMMSASECEGGCSLAAVKAARDNALGMPEAPGFMSEQQLQSAELLEGIGCDGSAEVPASSGLTGEQQLQSAELLEDIGCDGVVMLTLQLLSGYVLAGPESCQEAWEHVLASLTGMPTRAYLRTCRCSRLNVALGCVRPCSVDLSSTYCCE